MTHITRIGRHVGTNILSSLLGGSLLMSVLQPSVVSALVTAAAGAALLIWESFNVKEEESHDHEGGGLYLGADAYKKLQRISQAEFTDEDLSTDQLKSYKLGLRDGQTTLAQLILEEADKSI